MGQLQSLVILLDILSVLSLCFGGALVKSNGDLDELVVEQHILQLEQTVSSLQRELKLQEQKQAAVLSSVLSKLTSTTNELTNLKSDFHNLENNYTSSVLELSTVKHQLSTQIKEFSKMNNEFKTLKKDHDFIKVELAFFKGEQNSTEAVLTVNTGMLEKLQENATSVVSEIEFTRSDQNDLRKRVETLEWNMTSALETTAPSAANISNLMTDVAFQATLPSTDIVNDTEIIQFPNDVYNRGGGYINTNGSFIAPVSGTYILFANIMVVDTSDIWVSMHKDSATIGTGYVTPGQSNSKTFIFVVTYLNQGNKVWLTKDKGGSKIYGNYYSSFGGALLTPH